MAEERKKLTLSLGGNVKPKASTGSGVKVEVKKKRTFSKADTAASSADEKAKKLEALLAAAKEEEKAEAEKAKVLSTAKAKQEKAVAEEKALADAAEKAKAEKLAAKKAEEEAKKAEEIKKAAAKRSQVGMAVDYRAKHSVGRKPAQEETKTEGEASAARGEKSSAAGARKKVFKKEAPTENVDYSARKKASKKSNETDMRRNKFSVSKAKAQYSIGGEEDSDAPAFRPANVGLKKLRSKKTLMEQKPKEKILKTIDLPEVISVKDLAEKLSEKSASVIKELMKMGTMATINQAIDQDTAELVATELGHSVNRVSATELEDSILDKVEDKETVMVKRPPVVTVMGHVDHGKTSLLDALRKTDVVAGEAGGITQHIGAYQVKNEAGERITFIDTPGHAAFSAMRARGANATDIVILVVAANDSIMPQTIEAIEHSKAAGVPIIVAINKIDLPDANAQKVRMDLLQHELVVEEMGGDVQAVEVSAKNKLNLDKLEEAILLQAEMLELKANPDRKAEGNVIEAEVKKGLGSTATVLIQRGSLKKGDVFVSGKSWGKVRDMIDDRGKSVKVASPSYPVAVLGFDVPPSPGDDFVVVDNEAKARKVAEFRIHKSKQEEEARRSKSMLENMFANVGKDDVVELPIIIKADVQGTIEALKGTLEKIGNEKAKCRVIAGSVGGITKNDVNLAKSSNALIVAFNVRAGADAKLEAKNVGVDIRYYSIIYDIADDVKDILSGKLEPEYKENFVGYANVIQTFKVGKSLVVAGCKATEGVIKRSNKCRIIRDDVVMYTGDIGQLKREKNDVKEVSNGMEFGMSFADYNDIKIGDKIECFELEEIAAKL
ncbi:MAG: translation initiation factor IF-2 [Alphaproteobacteria bacterium]|nr:translation initiation factor IF-2 [Alphaproteobacteria bacterium]